MNRLGIIDNELMFHGGVFTYWVDDGLGFSMLDDEDLDAPWLKISDFENLSGLLKIVEFLLTEECAWEYTAEHPEALYLDYLRPCASE